MNNEIQLSTILDHDKHGLVKHTTKEILQHWYSKKACKQIMQQFDLTLKIFKGKYKGYRACNTDYHDLHHTIDVFVATVRLIDGFNLSETISFSETLAVQTCIAALYHDVGYIQEEVDTEGTGAKYTKTHVPRGVEFLKANYKRLKLQPEILESIYTMILGTDLAINWKDLSFKSEIEKKACQLLASADLMGQMADRAYLEKLLFLYREFKEANFPGYETAFDILKNTATFYLSIKNRMDELLEKHYEYALPHFVERFKSPHNLYMEAIERQLAYLEYILEDSSNNFRKKLKRIDYEQAESSEKSYKYS